jgi:hypothetical protein
MLLIWEDFDLAVVNCTITGDTPANTLTISGADINGATLESSEPSHPGGGSRSIWYKFQTAIANNIVIDPTGSTGLNPQIAVYTGATIDALTPIVSGAGIISFTAADTDYYLAIATDSMEIF